MAKTIVGRPLLRIGQDRVGLGAFLEFLFRVRVARVFIRMMLNRQRAVGPLYLDLGRRTRNAQYFVIVLLTHESVVSSQWSVVRSEEVFQYANH